MRKILTVVVILALCLPAYAAQNALVTNNRSLTISVGNTFQVIMALNQNYNSLTIQNNNTADNCFIEVSGLVAAGNTTATTVTTSAATVTSAQASMIIGPLGSYVRYYPNLPRGPIVATCATSGDSLYVDTQ